MTEKKIRGEGGYRTVNIGFRGKGGYLAVIRRDQEKFVAYNEDGDWVTCCEANRCPAESGEELAEYMFREDEIGGVNIVDGETWVWILTH